MSYGGFKDLNRRAAADKVLLRDKAFNIAKNPKYDGYKGALASMVYNCFSKKKLQVESPRLQINLQLKMRICLIKIS